MLLQKFQENFRFIQMKIWFQKQIWKLQQSGRFIIFIMFYSLFLDNMLLTVIVPIVPDFLNGMNEVDFSNVSVTPNFNDTGTKGNILRKSLKCNSTFQVSCNTSRSCETYPETLGENDKVGLLFSSKAFVQLIANPVAGMLTNRMGCRTPLFIGCVILLASSLMFAFGQTYGWLFAARSIQGLGSACISISGMAMVADHYPDDESRGRNMGIAMGGIALGVLVGYPFGGIMYAVFGKTAPLLTIFSLLVVDVVAQLIILRPSLEPERLLIGTSIMTLMGDPYILLSAGAICVSTCAISTLEPYLPLWLMKVTCPPKWQLGMIFIPDSLGYLIGTTLFGSVAFRVARWLTATLSLLLVGICAILISFSTRVLQLLIPHFGIGLGIGVIDATVMPLLAYLVDRRYVTLYGSVYAIAQVAVSLAYCFGPLVGGELVRAVGFPWLIRGIGIINLIYCPLCYFLRSPTNQEEGKAINLKNIPKQDMISTQTGDNRALYHTFNNEE